MPHVDQKLISSNNQFLEFILQAYELVYNPKNYLFKLNEQQLPHGNAVIELSKLYRRGRSNVKADCADYADCSAITTVGLNSGRLWMVIVPKRCPGVVMGEEVEEVRTGGERKEWI